MEKIKNFRAEILKKRISEMSDRDIVNAILINPKDFEPDAISIMEKEIKKRQKYYRDLKKMKKTARKFAPDIIAAETDLAVLGYKEVRDPYDFVYWISMGFFVAVFLDVGTMFLLKNLNLTSPYVLHQGIYFFISAIFPLTAFYYYKKRKCPVCSKKMISLRPSFTSRETTYKYICNLCHIFISSRRKHKDDFYSG